MIKATTIFVMDERAFVYAKAKGFNAVKTPWQYARWREGDSSHLEEFIRLCKKYKMRPCLVTDGIENAKDGAVQQAVMETDKLMRSAFTTFDRQCGPEIQEGVGDHAGIWSMGKKVRSWTTATKKFAPPISVINGSAWACQTIDTFYVDRVEPSVNIYFDHQFGIVDEPSALRRMEWSFRKRGVTYKQISVMEWGMCLARIGALGIADAYTRIQTAVEGAFYPYVAQFAIMDGVSGPASFGLLTDSYTLSPIGSVVA